jgi:virginiamycin A acetyltransferase
MSPVRAIQVRLRPLVQRSRNRLVLWRLSQAGHLVDRTSRVHPTVKVKTPMTIGPFSGVNENVVLKGGGPVTIGAHCTIGPGVVIITSNHRSDTAAMAYMLSQHHGWPAPMGPKLPTVIGNGVWIGENVIVLPGVTIGDGAICAAGAVVAHDVEPFSIAGGVPARQLKHRFSADVMTALHDIAWWTWDEAKVANNRRFFEADLSSMTGAAVRQLVVG